jgi:hypothetical protein
MDIGQYIGAVESGFFDRPGVVRVERSQARRETGNRAKLRFRLVFFDGSILDIAENVDTTTCGPKRFRYAYQYLKRGRRVFRYDNAEHHPEVRTHPDHKHVIRDDEEEIQPSRCPSHNQLFNEIASLLEWEVRE